MPFIKKILILSSIAMVLVGNGSFSAEDDLFEQIQKGLVQPTERERRSVFSDFAHAIGQRESYIAYKELYLSGRYSSTLEKTDGRNSVGFLLFGTFSGAEGQLGDANVQGRATYYNNQFAHGKLMPRAYTKRLNQLKLELHNAYVRVRAAPPACNVRVGHFYVPFGLQPWIDTHGTLLQGPANRFVGFERDWGIAIDGQNESMEYEVGLTRGSGMDYFNRRNNYIFAGKISTPRIGEHLDDWIGLSYMVGRVYDPMAVKRLSSGRMRHDIVPRWRIAIDGQKIIGPARLRVEISGGKDTVEVLGEFFELQYILDNRAKWYGYVQLENITQQRAPRSDTTLRLGLTYTISANYNVQFVASQDVNTTWGKKDRWLGLLLYGQI